MPETLLTGMRVAILATDDFEKAELSRPRRALQNAGAQPIPTPTRFGSPDGASASRRYRVRWGRDEEFSDLS